MLVPTPSRPLKPTIVPVLDVLLQGHRTSAQNYAARSSSETHRTRIWRPLRAVDPGSKPRSRRGEVFHADPRCLQALHGPVSGQVIDEHEAYRRSSCSLCAEVVELERRSAFGFCEGEVDHGHESPLAIAGRVDELLRDHPTAGFLDQCEVGR